MMAIPINVEELLRQRVIENARIEYKADWNPEPILHSITAFANDFDNLGGGYIVIGVGEQNGYPRFPVKGLEKNILDTIQKEVFNKCNFIEPRYIPVIEPALIDGRDVLI
ncbi:MAG: putative DNA binding domain-containing protein, partial [Lachnospiraceae bacterium]|nr:putative DNA binding domain-containing protein [Lachnospiraceae bacterium]